MKYHHDKVGPRMASSVVLGFKRAEKLASHCDRAEDTTRTLTPAQVGDPSVVGDPPSLLLKEGAAPQKSSSHPRRERRDPGRGSRPIIQKDVRQKSSSDLCSQRPCPRSSRPRSIKKGHTKLRRTSANSIENHRASVRSRRTRCAKKGREDMK